ncbi:5-guanidino-2-oxopentanoate decarboxylase [Zavarzinia compransoris]|uniref:5-guanidino-2-oxopentanoate decarboxylase n=1 Tax=Zavarzinia marina TaxID=2911065 RepID=UPI001F2F7FA2|nr:5-guanidino-2-oxopentanoate decarboxylase [Zavarzinia marina]MCF4166894.1 5-guanidino-2-oxopentanoate decarboxylase [Zavarzinia marina]
MPTVGEALIRLLEAYGTEVVFGIPGVHNVEFYRGLIESPIRHVTPRHEQGGGFMADGYARVTGRPGVCFTISGPGLTNILTAMGQAYADSVPLLVIASVAATVDLGTGDGRLHELPSQCGLAAGVAAFAQTIHHPRQLAEAVARAMAVFAGARPRPVYLEIPVDVIAMDGAAIDLVPRPLPAPPGPDGQAMAEAGYLLANATRPLMILGGGAVGAQAKLRWIAEHLSIPVITTINAKGMLPPDHALLAGENLAAEPLLAEWKAADVVLAIGTELGETEMYPGPVELPPRGDLIRIDIDPAQLMRGPRATIAMVADARLAADALAARIEHSAARLGGEIRARRLRAALHAQLPDYARRHQPILAVIDRVLPAATVVGDSTEMVYAANQFFHPRAPRRFFNSSTGYGTLGYGLPAGIGARIGLGSGTVVVLAGDGGLLFTVAELAAAVEAGVPVVVVVWNNGGYGEIRKYMVERAIAPLAVDLRVPDILAVAAGFGANARRAASLDELAVALEKAAAAEGPTVILLEESDFAAI